MYSNGPSTWLQGGNANSQPEDVNQLPHQGCTMYTVLAFRCDHSNLFSLLESLHGTIRKDTDDTFTGFMPR